MLTKLDNALGMERLYVEGLQAYGTSEGAKKGWDSRGRGRKAAATKGRAKGRVQLTSFKKVVLSDAGRLKLHANYTKLGKKIDKLSDKLERPEEVKHVASKFLHFIKRVGDWIESLGSVREFGKFIVEAGTAVYIAAHEYSLHLSSHVNTAGLHSALTWAQAHIAPVMFHIQHAAVMGGI